MSIEHNALIFIEIKNRHSVIILTLLLIIYGGITSISNSSINFLTSILIKSPAKGDLTMAGI